MLFYNIHLLGSLLESCVLSTHRTAREGFLSSVAERLEPFCSRRDGVAGTVAGTGLLWAQMPEGQLTK